VGQLSQTHWEGLNRVFRLVCRQKCPVQDSLKAVEAGAVVKLDYFGRGKSTPLAGAKIPDQGVDWARSWFVSPASVAPPTEGVSGEITEDI
jgi:hypothetical protein